MIGLIFKRLCNTRHSEEELEEEDGDGEDEPRHFPKSGTYVISIAELVEWHNITFLRGSTSRFETYYGTALSSWP